MSLMAPRLFQADALDLETEQAFIDDLKAIFQGKTVLMIAHRPSALAVADWIVSLRLIRYPQKGVDGC